MNPRKKFASSLLLGVLVLIVAGCGDSGGPNPKTEQARMDKAVQMRSLFNKAGGDYSKLDATDKAELDRLAGSSEAAQKTFAEMKQGPGGGPSTGPGQ